MNGIKWAVYAEKLGKISEKPEKSIGIPGKMWEKVEDCAVEEWTLGQNSLDNCVTILSWCKIINTSLSLWIRWNPIN